MTTKHPARFELPYTAVTLPRLQRVVGWAGEIANPHPETPVTLAVRQRARAAAVLMPFVDRPDGLKLLVTRRHRKIRFGGHICFPGGGVDRGDVDDVGAALRETREEIGVAPDTVEVIGSMGHYYTQTGYRIVPVLALLREPEAARCTDEVEAIYELDAARIMSGGHYTITWHGAVRGHVSYTEQSVRVAGPTVSLMTGLHQRLLAAA